MKRPEKIIENGEEPYYGESYGYNQACDDWEKYVKILEKKLELSKSNEERLCPDHRGKQIGNKTGCIACDAEYFDRKRSSLPSEEEIKEIIREQFGKDAEYALSGFSYPFTLKLAKAIHRRIRGESSES